MLYRVILFAAALALGTLLNAFRIPIPYLLGGIGAALCCKIFFHKLALTWPKELQEAGLMVAGYGIGGSFDGSAWNNFLAQLSGLLEATFLVFAAGIALAFLSAKLTKEDLPSCLLGMVPGGFMLAMLLAEEDRRLNPNVVMVMQLIRLIGVIVSVPFLVIYLLGAQVTGSSLVMPDHGGLHWLCLVPLAAAGTFLGKKLHIPIPVLLGTILCTAVFSVAVAGVQPVPGWLMCPAQLSIGLHMGMHLDTERMIKAKNTIPCVVLGTVFMIVISIGMAYVLSARYHFTLITAFLAMAPGGTAEMTLAGLSMGEDVSIILTYQIVRMLIINFSTPFLVDYCLKRWGGAEN